jgi:hypothetical protein
MVAALEAGAVEHSAVGCIPVEDLALEDAAVLQCEMKDIPLGGVGHGIEPYDCSLSAQSLQAVTDAAQVSMATV